ncbi:MAG: SDR family oxidoreductase [Prevotellaceae bacterium]|jgi:NAD(P)-dependent dehydrogenase (short-subunit alcohol dehydrogenase family)|nr:SDR family oxidoreductase [Prevotellaceae bacterium]
MNTSTDTIILITGASSGIGKACAGYLAAKGFTVYGASRKATDTTNRIHFLQMDVTQPATVQKAVRTIIETHGKIDVLINSAGMGIGGAVELAAPEEIRRQMETNFMGTVHVCTAVLPHMRAARHGKIINISSLAGAMAIPFQGFYSASKFAVEGYSEALSMEVQPFHIKVSVVEPGDFSTGFTASRIISDATLHHADYGARFKKCLRIVEKEETNGCKPIKLAKKLHKIIRAKHPKFRYRVGNAVQVVFTKAKCTVPSRLHQALLRFFYGV